MIKFWFLNVSFETLLHWTVVSWLGYGLNSQWGQNYPGQLFSPGLFCNGYGDSFSLGKAAGVFHVMPRLRKTRLVPLPESQASYWGLLILLPLHLTVQSFRSVSLICESSLLCHSMWWWDNSSVADPRRGPCRTNKWTWHNSFWTLWEDIFYQISSTCKGCLGIGVLRHDDTNLGFGNSGRKNCTAWTRRPGICSCYWIKYLLQWYISCRVFVGFQFKSALLTQPLQYLVFFIYLCLGIWQDKIFIFQDSLWAVMSFFVTKWCM